ncbi:MAG: acireductone synthase [Cyanobacteria bacterium]|nr:acireductone synthase [Cyanobacteriota bacterium]
MTTLISHILLDIEGTTCPVSFVSGTLFPYAARELGPFLERHQQEVKVQELVATIFQDWQQDPDPIAQQLFHNAAGQEIRGEEEESKDSRSDNVGKHKLIVPYLQWLISVDLKYTPLKELQGMVWNEGYGRGELKSTLFDEVADTLQRWHEQGLVLGVYSSGSIAAQKLLYGHSQAGDLRPLFQYWFDTHIGSKHEVDSYRHICEVMQVNPQQVLFISDCEAELEAEVQSNLQVILSDRDNDQPVSNNPNPQKPTTSIAGTPRQVSRLDQIELLTKDATHYQQGKHR